ncbi:synergin gamma isoform X2 [Paroedura picta]|uniref:synergin gamma isoform X2 n=1 Tax=Paroedura picta TaxID=143630 RepID=UPI004055EF31
MALRPGLGAGGASAPASAGPPGVVSAASAAASASSASSGAAGGGGPASFMFPVPGGLGPPQGMIPMQQQGFPMMSVMQPNMQGMMGVNYGAQMPPGTMTMQGGMSLGPMPTAGMPYMGQAPFLGMRPAAPQYTPDMRKQFVEEQQKRYEHQQKFLEEERKRRQFEEQKQKLRLLSSVKPKMGEKSRDDALEAIKGNLDGFSRDAKLHPTPTSHPKNADHPTPSHSTVSVSHTSAFPDDEEFSDFIQGPVGPPALVPPTSSQPFQSCHPSSQAGQWLCEKAVAQPLPPVQVPVSSILHGTIEQGPYLSPSATSQNTQKTGHSTEEQLPLPCSLNEFGETQIKFKRPEIELVTAAVHCLDQSLTANNCKPLGELAKGTLRAGANKASDQNLSVEQHGVGIFPSQDPIQQLMPPWIYNDSLVPDLYKKILETTMMPTGIDTGKLYPVLMSSRLPRETLGQIWALANRTTPGKLTKEELYTVLAMIAVTQRGVPAMSPDVLNQFPSAPIPTLSGFPVAIPVTVSQQPMMSPGPPVSMSLSMGPPGVGINLAAPLGGAPTQVSSGFVQSFPAQQAAKPEDDDFQDFQDASKSGGLDDTFTNFQGDTSGSTKTTTTQHRSSAPPMLIPLPGTKVPTAVDRYAVFKGIASDKPAEGPASLGHYGDKYSAFRELEQPSESKPLGDSFAEFKSAGADDGFTDFKTADSVSPLDPPMKDKLFPAPFSSLLAQSKQQRPAKPSLNLADLSLFSSASAGENRSLQFPASYSSSLPVPPPPTSTTAPLPSNSSITAHDFADFNLLGGLSSGPSAHTQDEFADFMAFNNSASSTEQKLDEKSNTFKPDASPVPLTAKSGQSPPSSAAPTKYDIFKQLSLDSSGLGFEETKDHTPSSAKSEDDFADFHSNKFSSSSDKSLVDKLAAFRHSKEDSASVKSLDLPSIGGSSVGKEDSEDALSVQFDMKLADVGGDLKHVMSDSSLDLPTVSGQHPPAADLDDLKGALFGSYSHGSALSSFPSLDWSDKEDTYPSRKCSSFPLPPGSSSSSATSVLQKKETLFGSSENITMTTVSRVTTFTSEDALQEVKFSPFANFKGSDSQSVDQSDDDVEDFGDFARPLAEVPEAPAGILEAGAGSASLGITKEGTDDFGEFQSEKPKISKFDFLLATSQGKMKSSEEMIKSELATFDLSVQGSHKRSLSLGDREINRSSPLPALEQPFRDRSNTLSEKPALPVIRDKYKDLTGEVEESERYAYEWQRCLESALQIIKKANDTLNGISSSSVCTEVIQSAQGMEYLLGVVEVYRVTKRVELGIKATAVCSEKLQQLLKDLDKVWNNLISFMSLAALTPDENSLDFSSCMLRPGIKNAQELACGVCLLNVNSRSKKEEKPAEEPPREVFNSETDNFKLAYGGHQYHASCANFWINCVEPKPPGLILPDLL